MRFSKVGIWTLVGVGNVLSAVCGYYEAWYQLAFVWAMLGLGTHATIKAWTS